MVVPREGRLTVTEEEVRPFLEMTPLVEKAIAHSGVLLLKYRLEVSPEEQTRRLEGRIDDGRKIWKRSDTDLKSYSRWYEYSKARNDMFLATDSSWASWYVAHSDNKRRARFEHRHAHSEQDPIRGPVTTGGRTAETRGARRL